MEPGPQPSGWILPDSVPAGPAPGYEYAGFWRRFWAYLVDSLILGIPMALLAVPLLGSTFSSFSSLVAPDAFLFDPTTGRYVANPTVIAALTQAIRSAEVVFVLFYGIEILYFALAWSRRGASLGQQLLGVEVRNEETGAWIGFRRGCVRAFGYLVSGLPFDLGFMWAAFDARKQGWHDKMAGTVVVRKTSRRVTPPPLPPNTWRQP
jgi:uncharacterized RDD family membrane protein YckC